MIIKPTTPTYADRRASLKVRKSKRDEPDKCVGRWMIAIGLLIMLAPAIVGLPYFAPLGAAIWIIVGLYWLWAGLKAVGL